MKMKKLISTLLSASMILSTAVFSVQAAAEEPTAKAIVPTNRGYGTVTDNGDGTYRR